MNDHCNIFDELAAASQVLGTTGNNEGDRILHIAFGVDDNFIKYMGITILSILFNNTHHKFVFHVITEHVSTTDIEKLTEIAHKYNTIIILHFTGKKIFSNLQASERFPKAVYNRLLAPHLLKTEAQFVLYLDSDILCMKPIDELLSLDIQPYTAGVVTDWDPKTNQEKKLALKITGGGYFNSGVIYMNIPKWLEEQISMKALRALQENSCFNLPDQDVLNSVLDGNVFYMDQKFNTLYSLANMKTGITPETVFLHYTGPLKPWHPDCAHPLQKHYNRYAALSPWNFGLEEAFATSYKAKILLHARDQGYWD